MAETLVPAPASADGGEPSLSEQSEDVAAALSEMQRTSRWVGEIGYLPGSHRAEAEETDARRAAEAAILGFAAAIRREPDTRASWLAAFLIEHHGATPDLPAWIEQSARFYRDMVRERDQAVSRALQAAADVCESRAKSLSEDSGEIMLSNEAHKCARAILCGALDRITGIPFSLTTSTVDLLTTRNLQLQARIAELEAQLPHKAGCDWERGLACNCRHAAAS